MDNIGYCSDRFSEAESILSTVGIRGVSLRYFTLSNEPHPLQEKNQPARLSLLLAYLLLAARYREAVTAFPEDAPG